MLVKIITWWGGGPWSPPLLLTFVIIVVKNDFSTITVKGFPKVGGNGDGCVVHCYFLGTFSLMQQIANEGKNIYKKKGEGPL